MCKLPIELSHTSKVLLHMTVMHGVPYSNMLSNGWKFLEKYILKLFVYGPLLKSSYDQHKKKHKLCTEPFSMLKIMNFMSVFF